MKKKIILIGSSSDIANSVSLDSNYELIKLSSKTSNFNILKPETFPTIEKIEGLVYFPGTINLKPFKSIKKEEFIEDYNINVLGIINILQHYQNSTSLNSLKTIIKLN